MDQPPGTQPNRRVRDLIGWVALALALLAWPPAAVPSSQAAAVQAAAARYLTAVSPIAARTGRDTAMDYYQRLTADRELLDAPAPAGYPQAYWTAFASQTAQLDVSLADQLSSNTIVPMAGIRGLGETLVRSTKDGTLQPVAVYVPAGYSADRPAGLAVWLHGRGQSETELFAQAIVTGLADASGTILIAPYGRGYYDFRGSQSDLDDAFAAASSAFAIDPRERFLIGYSMGGFSVFSIAPRHPDRWSAVMSIAGALLSENAHPVTAMLSRTPFYILTGARDDSVPTQYPTVTATYLRDAGVPVTFYSDPQATHRLYTLRTILGAAWNDMQRGIVRTPVGLKSGFWLPTAAPLGEKT